MSLQTSWLIKGLLTLLTANASLAQVLPFRQFTHADGLASNGVSDLLQDSRGFLWIGTANGLTKYDGYSFTNFDRRHGLPTTDITCLLERRENAGHLWVGTSGGGLAVFDGDGFRHVSVGPWGHPNIISSLAEAPSGTLWIATFGGLFRYDTSMHPVIPRSHLENGSHVRSINSETICFAFGDSLFLLSHGRIAKGTSLRRLSAGIATSLGVTGNSTLVVGMSDGMILRFNNSLELLSQARYDAGPITAIHSNDNQDLWLGTRRGFSITGSESTGQMASYGTREGLPEGEVTALITDRENNLWAGVKDRGLVRLGTFSLVKFPMADISDAYDNRRAVVDSAGHLWVATRSGRIVEIWKTEGGNWSLHSHHKPALAGALLFYDSRHRLWAKGIGQELMYFRILGTKDSSSRLVGKTVRLPGGPAAKHDWSTFIVTNNNHLWSSLGGVGILYADLNTGKVVRLYGTAEGVPGDLSIRVVYQDMDENVWLGGFLDGVAVALAANGFEPPLKRFTMDDGLPDNWIRSIVQGAGGAIWIGTRRSGLAILDHDSLTVVSTLNGLASDAVWGLATEGDAIWAATTMGVQQIHNGRTGPLPLQRYLRIPAVGACGPAGKGRLWFATLDAFYVYEHQGAETESTPPPVHITSVEVNGLLRHFPASLASVGYDEDNWTMTFVGLSFRHEGELTYEYRLLGLEERWSHAGRSRSVSFSSLAPGEYEFQVRARTPDGVISTAPAQLLLAIAPPFWATWWFRGCTALAFFAAVGMVYRSRIGKLRQEEQAQRQYAEDLLASQERERSRIAGELHDSLVQDLLVAKNRSLMGLQRSSNPAAMKRQLREISETMSRAIEEVREVAHNLRPYQLDRLGLVRAIQSLVTAVSESSSIRFTLECAEIDPDFTGDRSILLYRILQEATNNIIRHSLASEAEISLRRSPSSVEITIRDNGKGFVTDGWTGTGLGLSGIAQRVRMMGGVFTVTSAPGAGTTLNIIIPVDENTTTT